MEFALALKRDEGVEQRNERRAIVVTGLHVPLLCEAVELKVWSWPRVVVASHNVYEYGRRLLAAGVSFTSKRKPAV